VERAPPSSALEAFARADWESLLPKLTCAAGGLLRVQGCAERGRRRSFVIEPDELVNSAIDACLDGRRSWVPGTGATEASLVAFLCETMRSIAVNERTRAGIALRDDGAAIEEERDDRPSPSRELAAREQITQIARALADDPEATAVHRMICEGYTEREEIALALGWKVERVKAVRLRASRRLAAMHVTLDDDGELPESAP
jgi:DNA-directed RNA polymerase specialized sigma24 family protein